MSLEAKKEGLFRLIGTILIVGGFFIALILDFYVINNPVPFIFEVITISLWFFIVVSFKLEIEAIVDNIEKIIMPLIIYSLAMITAGASLSTDPTNSASFIFLTISSVLCLICWHYSLSIYKKEKIIFLGTGIGYVLITIILRLVVILTLIPFLVFLAGFLLIIYAENNMKKKGLLNYIE